jgi:hypothetical protein
VTTPSPSLMSLLNPGAVSQGGTSSHRAALAVENAHNTMIAVCKFFLIHSSKNTIQYVIILAMDPVVENGIKKFGIIESGDKRGRNYKLTIKEMSGSF